jgi:hypothetical protein
MITPSLATVFVTLFVLGTAATVRADEPRACTNASLRGSFGFTSQGALLAGVPPPIVGPFGEVGRQSFDGRGNTDGTATLSANGTIVRVTVQGSYVVNPDCTGSMTLSVAPLGIISDLDFVIDDNGNELRAIVTEAGAVETRVYTKQVSRGHED